MRALSRPPACRPTAIFPLRILQRLVLQRLHAEVPGPKCRQAEKLPCLPALRPRLHMRRHSQPVSSGWSQVPLEQRGILTMADRAQSWHALCMHFTLMHPAEWHFSSPTQLCYMRLLKASPFLSHPLPMRRCFEAPRPDDTPCVGREMSNPAVPNWGCAPGTTCERVS